jgi:hypothetical protein
MNWYKQSQTDEDDDLRDSFRDTILEDASEKATSHSGDKYNVFKGSFEKIFSMFGFKIASWSMGDEDNVLLMMVFPTKKVERPNSYDKTVKLRNDMAGLDRDKGDKLAGYLKEMPGVIDVAFKPSDFGVDWTIVKVSFDKKAHLVFASDKYRWYKRAQTDEAMVDWVNYPPCPVYLKPNKEFSPSGCSADDFRIAVNLGDKYTKGILALKGIEPITDKSDFADTLNTLYQKYLLLFPTHNQGEPSGPWSNIHGVKTVIDSLADDRNWGKVKEDMQDKRFDDIATGILETD